MSRVDVTVCSSASQSTDGPAAGRPRHEPPAWASGTVTVTVMLGATVTVARTVWRRGPAPSSLSVNPVAVISRHHDGLR